MTDSLGIYISVPFCKAKCTYCNFASGVFGSARMDAYVERVCTEIAAARPSAERMGLRLPDTVDTIFFGGGTPSLLSAEQMRRLFTALRREFEISAGAEVTLECAPGQLADETLGEMLRLGMNRMSFGVQSFVDAEAKAVGRLHTREMCLAEVARMRAAGVTNINVDLIAGLPGQTATSWRESVEIALKTEVPHVSVYMLEVDEDSRLGREMLGSGKKYGAGNVASDDEIAEWYGAACQSLEMAGVNQYEISNFARKGHPSQHNLKYWRREPYVGFGLDAHSMLRDGVGGVRWANPDDLDRYLESAEPGADHQESAALIQFRSGSGLEVEQIGPQMAFEESVFLGLRLNEGVELDALREQFGGELTQDAIDSMEDIEEAGLVTLVDGRIRLTACGRMASNEVFSRLLTRATA